MPQDDRSSILFDISDTAFIPSVHRHMAQLIQQFGIELVDTGFRYTVRHGQGLHAHDFQYETRHELRPDIAKFQQL